MNRTDFQELAELRIREAEFLLSGSSSFPDGAYYLAGYAVECGLKACIAKMVKEQDFPDKELTKKSYTHNFSTLVEAAQLEDLRRGDIKQDSALAMNWSLVSEWTEQSRYERHSQAKSQVFFNAVVCQQSGVLTWIKRYW